MLGTLRPSRLRIPTDKEWTQSRVAGLPSRWQRALLARWRTGQKANYRNANIELREATDSFLGGQIPLAASDDDICKLAENAAKHCADLSRVLHEPVALRLAMESYCKRRKIAAPPEKIRLGPALSRMTCTLWWRRKLRRRHGRALESAAINLGLVSKFRDLYVSQECFEARSHQNRRNQHMLESTLATNEFGQTYTLAELASFGTSKKSNRRAELMTRVRGFDALAQENNHAGLFVTVTCPSRFHRFKIVNKGALAVENKKYDPKLTPASGQKYLAELWARIRSKLHRDGIRVYGFRVSEPQHDGTPHWHMLLFCEQSHASHVAHTLRQYALKDTPDEAGAQEHRCLIKEIDWSKGSAAGYIAKYISKNIDGEHVGNDFHDRVATQTAKRVEAWAATWSIRQFQQIGGPPVSVWRELRRIAEIPSNAPTALKLAHAAANKRLCDEETGELRVFWDKYCIAQGGVFCGRNARIRLMHDKAAGFGRYGDEPANRPCGVRIKDSCEWRVHSLRHTWTLSIAPKLGALISGGTKFGPSWTRVNNCTRHTVMPRVPTPANEPVELSATPIEGIHAHDPEITPKGKGGAGSELTRQPPNLGDDVQEAAPRAGAEASRSQSAGLRWGASPATAQGAVTTVGGCGSNDEPG